MLTNNYRMQPQKYRSAAFVIALSNYYRIVISLNGAVIIYLY